MRICLCLSQSRGTVLKTSATYPSSYPDVTNCRKNFHEVWHWGLALFSKYIIRMIKSRRMQLTGHVARMREKRNAYRIFLGKTERNRPL
jgi:hypothetical protein